ncbi:hypothetical protein H9Q70_010540 [Fusarium xylarioides]|nr:hypothetical protein H9Q70_010540 [Fusarium xylarioides]
MDSGRENEKPSPNWPGSTTPSRLTIAVSSLSSSPRPRLPIRSLLQNPETSDYHIRFHHGWSRSPQLQRPS